MRVFMVTSKATERDNAGVVLRAYIRCHGVFTVYSRAYEIAQRFNGDVVGYFLDADGSWTVAQWDNPGYTG